MKTLAPYPILTGDIVTSISGVELDGVRLTDVFVDTESRRVELRDDDHRDWRTLTVHLQVKGPIDELSAPGAPWTRVRPVGTAQCSYTDFRVSEELTEDVGQRQRWSGSIELDRTETYGSVEITGVLTATVEGEAARQIGRDEGWTISLDDVPRPPAGDALTMEWQDFSDPTDPEGLAILKKNANLPTFLLIGNNPTLYLNRGFQGLEGLLASGRRSKPESALHDAVRTFIAAQTWMTLFIDAIQYVKVDEDEGSVEWPDESWRTNVLRVMLARLQGASDDGALMKVYEEFNTADSVGILLQQIHVACSEISRTPRLLANALNNISHDSEQS